MQIEACCSYSSLLLFLAFHQHQQWVLVLFFSVFVFVCFVESILLHTVSYISSPVFPTNMQNQYKWIAIVQLLLLAVHGLSPTDYRVFGLEKFGSIDEIYSGHMPLYLEDNTEGSFFFYMAKMRITQGSNKEKNKKLVIWLNGMKVISPVLIDFVKLYIGGPGCTSLLGAFFENGPLTLKGFGNNSKVYDIRPNPYSWNEVADVVFVEQPIRCYIFTLQNYFSQLFILPTELDFHKPLLLRRKLAVSAKLQLISEHFCRHF